MSIETFQGQNMEQAAAKQRFTETIMQQVVNVLSDDKLFPAKTEQEWMERNEAIARINARADFRTHGGNA